jgi:PAS domain S-box-containing protein
MDFERNVASSIGHVYSMSTSPPTISPIDTSIHEEQALESMVTSTFRSDYQRLFDALADPVFVLDMKNEDAIRIIVANAACETFFGAPAAHCTDKLLADVLPISAALRLSTESDRCKATGQSIEFRLELNARAFGVKLSVIPDSDAAEHIAAVVRAASVYSGLDHDPDAEQFRVIAEYAADFISRCDREARVLYLNPAVERLMGVKYESLVGKNVSEWVGEIPHAEPYRECIRRVVETGKPQMLEARLLDPSSGRLVYHQVRYAPEWDSNGEVRSVIGIGRDITQLKAAEAELRLLNATLEKRVSARTLDLELANRDLRSFASTVSHDLRAPLRAIGGYLASSRGRGVFGAAVFRGLRRCCGSSRGVC